MRILLERWSGWKGFSFVAQVNSPNRQGDNSDYPYITLQMQRAVYIVFFLILTFANSCRRDEGGYIWRLDENQKSKFPEDYYSQYILRMVYSDSLRTDTMVLLGDYIERIIVEDFHTAGDNGYTTYHELIRKTFRLSDSDTTFSVSASTVQGDDGFPPYGGIKIQALGYYVALRFSDIKDTTGDQFVPVYSYHRNTTDSVLYNTLSGVKKVRLGGQPIKNMPDFTLEFF